MACPRCETPLTTYALAERNAVAVVCEQCGFADVPAAEGERGTDRESWDDALDRFANAIAPVIEAEHTDRTRSVTVPEADSVDKETAERAFEATRVAIESPEGASENGEKE